MRCTLKTVWGLDSPSDLSIYFNYFYRGCNNNFIRPGPPCKDYNIRFTTEPLKASSDQVRIRYPCFFFELFIFIYGFSAKWLAHFLLKRDNVEIFRINSILVRKTTLSSTFLIRLRFQGDIIFKIYKDIA